MDIMSLMDELSSLREQKTAIVNRENQITDILADHYREQLAGQTGTVKLDGIIFNVPKRVKWDQDILATLWDKCVANNEDPFEYMKRSLDVPESKYKAWPKFLQEEFEPARTVETGKVTIKLSNEPNT